MSTRDRDGRPPAWLDDRGLTVSLAEVRAATPPEVAGDATKPAREKAETHLPMFGEIKR